jgi:hypothetical protein
LTVEHSDRTFSGFRSERENESFIAAMLNLALTSELESAEPYDQ